MVEILDTTLREGELTPNVCFSNKQKVEIAILLDKFGVDFIELGHPAVSKDIKRSVKTIANIGLRAQTICHARCCKEDIRDAKECGTKWVGIFMGINNYCLDHKYHLAKKQAQTRISNTIKYAKDLGLKVRYTPEDSTRTKFKDLIRIISIAKKAGADRISIADTVGKATPAEFGKLIRKIKAHVDIDLNVHCHNDFGMAVANSLAAYEAGAKLIDVTVNGLGERVGIAPLEIICTALSFIYKEKKIWKYGILASICSKISKYSGIPIHDRMPIIGEDSFTHKSGIHIAAVLSNPSSYEYINPKHISKNSKYVISKFIGEKGLKEKLKCLGYVLPEDKLKIALNHIKNNTRIKTFDDSNLINIIKRIK